MAVSFGLSMLAGPEKGQTQQWMQDLDESLPHFVGHCESLWMTDHFFWEDKPTYEAWTTLCYVAARWPQFKVGPIVLGQSYRNPALLAKMASTLQALSSGRFIMAIGAGWKEDEYRAYDYPYPRAGIRIEQLEDTLEIMKRMWTEPGPVSYQGKHYKVVDAYCEPKPTPVPPILVGGGGEKTMMLAARYADWWNLSDANFAKYSDRVRILRDHCATIGRAPSTMRLTWFGRLAVGKTEADAQALGGTKWTRDNAFVGTPMQVIEQMRPFVDLGVDYFMLEILGLPNPSVIQMVLEDVFPHVGR
jgi:alkanesulfonate monooxygenase SsuD/methylene tetrahydromethanopterin reductase-like flavin-dependent oxidoreductase (luciferase family)